jgi:RecA-family ATPase
MLLRNLESEVVQSESGNGETNILRAPDSVFDKFKAHAASVFADRLDLSGLKLLNSEQLLKTDVPEREKLLGNLILSRTINNVSAEAGLGKTTLTMALCAAIATAGKFLSWEAESASKVLYVDGEMLLSDLKSRIKTINTGLSVNQKLLFMKNMIFLNGELCESGLPSLLTQEGQTLIELKLLESKARVIVLDNLTSLLPDADSADTVAMKAFLQWLKNLRYAGYTVITINHMTKSGARCGSVVLDTYNDMTIDLIAEIKNKQKTGNTRFMFAKSRHLSSSEKRDFVYRYDDNEVGQTFTLV